MAITKQYAPVETSVTVVGEVVIPFTWSAASTAHVVLLVGDTPAPTSVYSVQPHDLSSGGEVRVLASYNNALPKPTRYSVVRVTPLTQPDVYKDRQQIPSRTLEGSLDNLSRQIQETVHNGVDIGAIQEQLKQVFASMTLIDVTDARQDMELAALRTKDQQYGVAIADLQSGLTAETQARIAAIDALEQSKADKNSFLAFVASVTAQLANVWKEMDGLMPMAPDDGGAYVGSGRNWIPFSFIAGDPFVVDDTGVAHLIARPNYLPNKVWNTDDPGAIFLRQDAQPGDSDSVWIIDSEGAAVLKQA